MQTLNYEQLKQSQEKARLTASAVPGRKKRVRTAMIFIEAPSCWVSIAMRCAVRPESYKKIQ